MSNDNKDMIREMNEKLKTGKKLVVITNMKVFKPVVMINPNTKQRLPPYPSVVDRGIITDKNIRFSNNGEWFYIIEDSTGEEISVSYKNVKAIQTIDKKKLRTTFNGSVENYT